MQKFQFAVKTMYVFVLALQRAALREFAQVTAKRNDKWLLLDSGKNAGISRPCSRHGP